MKNHPPLHPHTQQNIAALLLVICSFATNCPAAQVSRTATGANAAAIQATVDQFRADLGGANNGVGGTFKTGRREINWDGVPDGFAAPNFLPVDFFNVNSPRGVVFSAFTTFGDTSAFMVSADSNNPTTTPVRFGNLDPSYTALFQTFSAERLFVARSNKVTTVNFFIPGTSIPAAVKGFGVVFTDVDQAGPTYIKCYGPNGKLLGFQNAPTTNNGLSFVGISFDAGEQITRVDIIAGNEVLSSGIIDNGTSRDLVAMDDFIYGEPQPLRVNLAATPATPSGLNTAPLLPATVIEAHIPLSLTLPPSQTGVTAGFLRTSFRCSPHHTYRLFSSSDLINWTAAPIKGNAVGPDSNLFDPRSPGSLIYDSITASVILDLQKNGPSQFYRAVDQQNAEFASTPLVP